MWQFLLLWILFFWFYWGINSYLKNNPIKKEGDVPPPPPTPSPTPFDTKDPWSD